MPISGTDTSLDATLEIETADQTFCLTQSGYTDTGPTSPRTDPATPGAWQRGGGWGGGGVAAFLGSIVMSVV